jgi:hypothetical protein
MQTKSSILVRHAYDFSPYAEGMEAMRSTWTDSRLDDLKDEVVRQGERIDSLTRTIMVVGGGLFAAFIGLLAAMLGLIATQL